MICENRIFTRVSERYFFTEWNKIGVNFTNWLFRANWVGYKYSGLTKLLYEIIVSLKHSYASEKIFRESNVSNVSEAMENDTPILFGGHY